MNCTEYVLHSSQPQTTEMVDRISMHTGAKKVNRMNTIVTIHILINRWIHMQLSCMIRLPSE